MWRLMKLLKNNEWALNDCIYIDAKVDFCTECLKSNTTICNKSQKGFNLDNFTNTCQEGDCLSNDLSYEVNNFDSSDKYEALKYNKCQEFYHLDKEHNKYAYGDCLVGSTQIPFCVKCSSQDNTIYQECSFGYQLDTKSGKCIFGDCLYGDNRVKFCSKYDSNSKEIMLIMWYWVSFRCRTKFMFIRWLL